MILDCCVKEESAGEIMAARKMFAWLDLRRKSKTLSLAQKEITMAIKTVVELEGVMTAFAEGKRTEVEERSKELFYDESEIDNLRRLVFEELTKESLQPKYREDVLHIVKRLDVMADQVKDAARNVRLLLGAKIPAELLSLNVKMAHTLVTEANLLGSTIEMLGIAPPEAKELTKKVEEQESIVDADYLKGKALLSKYNNELDFATMLVLKDLLECMEEIADTCADTADYIRVLTVG